jgi:hypothetical protein
MKNSIAASVLAFTVLIAPACLSTSAIAQELPTPVTSVVLTGDRLSLSLTNQTGFPVEYQAIGDTESRVLPPNSTVTLRDLRIPVSLLFRSQVASDTGDRTGLITTDVRPNTSTGSLDITFKPTSDPLNLRSTVSVDANGNVYAY